MSAGRFSLRRARDDDAAQIAEVHRLAREAVYPDFVSPGTLAAHLAATGEAYWREEIPDETKEDEFYVVAEAAGRIVGFASLEGARLDRLYVAPSWWGSGVAQALFVIVRDRAAVAGAARLTLDCHIGNNRARRFYARLGGRETGTREDSFTDGTPAPVVDIVWDLTPR